MTAPIPARAAVRQVEAVPSARSKAGRAGVASYTRRTCATCRQAKPAADFLMEKTRARYWPDCAGCREAALQARIAPVLETARQMYETGVAFDEIRALLRVADVTARRLAAGWNGAKQRTAQKAARVRRASGPHATRFIGRKTGLPQLVGVVTIRCHVCTLRRETTLAHPAPCPRCGTDGATPMEDVA